MLKESWRTNASSPAQMCSSMVYLPSKLLVMNDKEESLIHLGWFGRDDLGH